MSTPLRKVQLDATQRYVPGGATTTANVGVPDLGGQVIDPMYMRQFLQRRPPRRRYAEEYDELPMAQPRAVNMYQTQRERQMQRAEDQARLAQLNAISGRPPLKMTTFGVGANNGYIPDTNAMTGAQRRMFLPNNSTNDPVADAQAEKIRQKLASESFNAFSARSRG